MTRTLSLTETTCIECGTWYETVDEAVECENLDREEREAAEDEYLREQEWETLTAADEALFLRELHQFHFES